MSQQVSKIKQTGNVFVPPAYEQLHVQRQLQEILQSVTKTVSKVWPLKDYVAVNPYEGLAGKSFNEARDFLQVFSRCELLMPLGYYQELYHQGEFSVDDIRTALTELSRLNVDTEVSLEMVTDALASDVDSDSQERSRPAVQTIADIDPAAGETDWSSIIVDEIGRICGAHYDESVAVWRSPWKDLPLFQAWRSTALHDREIEMMGLGGFRKFVESIPHTPEFAIADLLTRLQLPIALWETFLLSQAFSMPGWCAWTKYKDSIEEVEDQQHLIGLLAVRLAYDVALANAHSIELKWDASIAERSATFRLPLDATSSDVAVRTTLQKAAEVGFRERLITRINTERPTTKQRKLAQMVFCIDVRSERIRRKLEQITPEIETYGFAGFFGMPVEHVRLGDHCGDHHVPALIKPSFKLYQECASGSEHSSNETSKQIQANTRWKQAWSQFQNSAFGCFSFVESLGLLYVPKMLRKSGVGNKKQESNSLADESFAPSMRGLHQQGWTTSRLADLAENLLQGIGITQDFARLVVLCGHSSQTANNPLAASLDCGACGGHSGEANARFAALLLNQTFVREILGKRGIAIPDDTVFIGALHNTTTDTIQIFGRSDLPLSHQGDLDEFEGFSKLASGKTANERCKTLGVRSAAELIQRAQDWSEVRPEWGLAGNAAFFAGPRWMTEHINLDGRVFMHSYDHNLDPKSEILEAIMTAPMVVAHMINMQYYASSVDNQHFGSGDKTIHNVVGGFGILAGPGGDLMTGLPLQSLHDGSKLQHTPLRLQVILAAPRKAIDSILTKHPAICELIENDWLDLISIDDGQAFLLASDAWHETGHSTHYPSTVSAF